MLTGIITEITTSFPEGGTPELAVSGYDHVLPADARQELAQLDEGARQRRRQQLAERDTTWPPTSRRRRRQHAQIEQNQESDFEFLKKLADRNHFEFYVDAHQARCTSRQPQRSSDDGVVTLRWGEGLLSFKPEANLAGQVARSKSTAGIAKTKKAIVGQGDRGRRVGPRPAAKSGGETARARDRQERRCCSCASRCSPQAEANKRAEGRPQRPRQEVPDRRRRVHRPARDAARSQRARSTISARRSRRPTTSSRRRTRSTAAAIARGSK